MSMDASVQGELEGVLTGTGAALGGMSVTPRVNLVSFSVSVDAFTDALGNTVLVDDGESLSGSVETRVQAAAPGTGGLYGFLDVTHELSGDRSATVAGMALSSEAESTGLRPSVGGVHSWDEERYELGGRVGYMTTEDSDDLSGNLSLAVRF